MPPVWDCTAPPEAGKPNCGHATAPRPCYLGVGGITFVSQNPTAEHRRLSDSANRRADWKNWGPYLAERAWGTVREDYSASGDAWNHFPHDHARSRAYRWNEDGLAGYLQPFSESLPVSYGRSLDASLLAASRGQTEFQVNLSTCLAARYLHGPEQGRADHRPRLPRGPWTSACSKNKLPNCRPTTLSFSPRSSNWSGTTKCTANELRNWPRTLFGSN